MMKRLLYALLFIIVAVPTYALTPNGTTNWTKYSGNPIGVYTGIECPGVPHSEGSGLIEGKLLYEWFASGGSGCALPKMFLTTTDDPYNISKNITYLPELYGMSMCEVATDGNGHANKYNDSYQIVCKYNLNNYVYWFLSKNKINWTVQCNNNPVLADSSSQNAANYYNPNTGVFDFIVEKGSGGIFYYNGTDMCNLQSHGLILPTGGNPYMTYVNGTWVVLYGDVRSSNWLSAWAKGNRLDNLTEQEYNNMMPFQSPWELGQADMFAVIVPPESVSYFDKSWYFYYNGNQHDEGLAFDRENRTFYATFGVVNIGGFAPLPPITPPGVIGNASSTVEGVLNAGILLLLLGVTSVFLLSYEPVRRNVYIRYLLVGMTVLAATVILLIIIQTL